MKGYLKKNIFHTTKSNEDDMSYFELINIKNKVMEIRDELGK